MKIATGLLLLLSTLFLFAGKGDREAKDPHSSKRGCPLCHPGGTDKRDYGRYEKVCLSCHEGEEPHPSDVSPLQAIPPADFPTWEGRVLCITCHENPSCQERERTPFILRGGPYPRVWALCYRCHPDRGVERFNPHKEAVNEDGGFREEICTFCHKNLPDAGKWRKVTFPKHPDKICAGCHTLTPHPGALEHLVAPSKGVKRRMERFLSKRDIEIPLSEEGKIMCATCHDPHPPSIRKRWQGEGGWQGDPSVTERFTIPMLKEKVKRLEEEGIWMEIGLPQPGGGGAEGLTPCEVCHGPD